MNIKIIMNNESRNNSERSIWILLETHVSVTLSSQTEKNVIKLTGNYISYYHFLANYVLKTFIKFFQFHLNGL